MRDTEKIIYPATLIDSTYPNKQQYTRRNYVYKKLGGAASKPVAFAVFTFHRLKSLDPIWAKEKNSPLSINKEFLLLKVLVNLC